MNAGLRLAYPFWHAMIFNPFIRFPVLFCSYFTETIANLKTR